MFRQQGSRGKKAAARRAVARISSWANKPLDRAGQVAFGVIVAVNLSAIALVGSVPGMLVAHVLMSWGASVVVGAVGGVGMAALVGWLLLRA